MNSERKKNPEKKATLRPEEVATRLGISRTLTYKAMRLGEIPSIKIGGRRVVPIVALDAMLLNAGKTTAKRKSAA